MSLRRKVSPWLLLPHGYGALPELPLEVFFYDDRLVFAGRFLMLCKQLISVVNTNSAVFEILNMYQLANPVKGHGVAVVFVGDHSVGGDLS